MSRSHKRRRKEQRALLLQNSGAVSRFDSGHDSPDESPAGFRPAALEVFDFEIVDEPMREPYSSDKAQKMVVQAYEALRREDGREAERLLKECIEIEGEKPELLNNLAQAYFVQGREAEARALAHRVQNRWPDYFFGQVIRAQELIFEDELEAAAVILAKLAKRRRLHFTEFTALCAGYLQFHLAENDRESARQWLVIWKRVDPDDPNCRHFEAILNPTLGGVLRSLSRRLLGGGRSRPVAR